MKIIQINSEFYLIQDDEYIVGQVYGDLVANFDGKYWHVFTTNRLLPHFRQVLASTKIINDLPVLDRTQVEHYIKFLESEKEFSAADMRRAIRAAFINGQTNSVMMEAGLERDETDEYVESLMQKLKRKPGVGECCNNGIKREGESCTLNNNCSYPSCLKSTGWKVEIEMEEICRPGCLRMTLNGENSQCCGDKILQPKVNDGFINLITLFEDGKN